MLSVIIVSFNTEKLTQGAIESSLAEKSQTPCEIIVIDNNSQDGSLKMLESFAKKHHIVLIKNSENVGFAKANNQGIRIARGEYVLLLNSDTIVKKGALKKLIDFAKTHPDAGVVGPRLLNKDLSIQKSCFNFPTLGRAIREYWFNEKGYFKQYAPAGNASVEVDAVAGACFLITPKALKKVGGLNEKYFIYFEDIDYCRHVRRVGLKVYYLPEAEIVHLGGESGKKIADRENQWRRLIPSSKTYHGTFIHYLIYLVMLTGQKFGRFIPPILVALLTIPAFFNLLKPGFFPMQDDLQAFRVYEMDRCFDDLQIPCRWVPDAGYQFGYPQFNFYPPLPYYVGAILHRLGFQYIDSVKILFVGGYVLSAITIYILVSDLFGSWAGVVAGVLYTYVPYKAVEVYVRGALSEFWAQIFFPLILWAIYKLVKTGKVKYLVWLSISVAFLATTHTLMTMIFVPIGALWAVYWLIREKLSNLFKVIWGGLIGFGLSAFFVLPVLFERKFVHTEGILSGYFDYRQHFVSLYKLFLSREWGYGSSGFPDEKLNLSLGIIQWMVGLGAVILAALRYKKEKRFSVLTLLLSAIALFSIFMMHMKSSFIWAKLPFLWYLQFPWRFLAIAIFLLCLLAGFFIYFSGKYKYLIGSILVIASILLNISFFVPKDWLNITDTEKFSGVSWEKQLTISIFDYLPIYGVLPPWSKAPDTPEVLERDVKFLEYKKGSNYQEGTLEASKDSVIRLPLFDFPGMEVRVDGQKVPHRNDDCRNERYCRGLITFSLPSGRHEIFVKLYDTPVRKIGNIITLASLGTVAILMLKSKGR